MGLICCLVCGKRYTRVLSRADGTLSTTRSEVLCRTSVKVWRTSAGLHARWLITFHSSTSCQSGSLSGVEEARRQMFDVFEWANHSSERSWLTGRMLIVCEEALSLYDQS
jgi:hypothetical protein